MQAKIDMIGIITNNFATMVEFYKGVLGYKAKIEMDNFVELENEGVRLAISTSEVMAEATADQSYKEAKQGHSFELAFRVESAPAVDEAYELVVSRGAKGVKAPADMPWGQRTAFFADPDGNIHEIFTDLAEAVDL